jgi:trimethylamine--corrinoid protein Co-methyltransferase
VAQLNAEALSALAYTQVIRKGCPAIYGHYLSTVSMKSGAPMAGTPEISLMNFMIGQMARFYGVPWRTSNTLGGAKTFDAQAGYESATTLSWSCMRAPITSGTRRAGTRRACTARSPSSSSMPSNAPWPTAWPRASAGTISTKACGGAAISGRAGTTLAIPTPRKISSARFSCPSMFDNNSIEQWIADGSKEITARALGTETGRGQGRSAA